MNGLKLFITPNCYVDMLDRLQQLICCTVNPILAASLEALC